MTKDEAFIDYVNIVRSGKRYSGLGGARELIARAKLVRQARCISRVLEAQEDSSREVLEMPIRTVSDEPEERTRAESA